MYPIRADPELLDSHYLSWLLLSPEFTEYAVNESARARMPKLNRGQLFAWEAVLPSLEVQREMASRLSTELVGTQAILSKVAAERAAIEALPAALLREAFGG